MERITVTIPKPLLARIRRVAGKRGVSRFLAEAAERQLARSELLQVLDELDAKYGKASPELVREVDRDMRKFFGIR